jgi:hypothetical protein
MGMIISGEVTYNCETGMSMIIKGVITHNFGTGFIRIRDIETGLEYDAERMSARRIVGATDDGAMICEFEIADHKKPPPPER